MNVKNPDIKAAMDAGGWKSAKLFLKTYVHLYDASQKLVERMEEQSKQEK